jgi:hypothetical protein
MVRWLWMCVWKERVNDIDLSYSTVPTSKFSKHDERNFENTGESYLYEEIQM